MVAGVLEGNRLTARDLHNALRKTLVDGVASDGIAMVLVRTQWSKDHAELVLHADPSPSSSAGFQWTDFLSCLGFSRYEDCSFHGKCYARTVPEEFTLREFTFELRNAYDQMVRADDILNKCGISLPQKEGLGYFHDHPSVAYETQNRLSGNGHNVIELKEIKRSTDHVFEYCLTFIRNPTEQGFVTHYRITSRQHRSEYDSALMFLGLNRHQECPQFDFDPCCYTTLKSGPGDAYAADFNAMHFHGLAHRMFDARPDHFAGGVDLIISANKCLSRFGIALWSYESIPDGITSQSNNSQVNNELDDTSLTRKNTAAMAAQEYEYDVALSFAGPDRKYALELYEILVENDISVFYDMENKAFMWGKHLALTLSDVFSKMSRYCVIFVSREYKNRDWTTYELRSAFDRAVREKGSEYILPIRMDDTQLEGLSPSITYLSIDEGIVHIADILIAKIRDSK